ncbi:MAG: hypothetical protein CMF98_02370 [Candidatus Marinimicrobia bacterium]|nr:hypothetical protein [Candidatus Neomarinimicrobiota bacterium]OUW50837.1 MAG: hypothetical protein CBD50_00965 [bacterium TMED190]|tara:strand:+ start:8254 stop:8802 length:549 start_codon:yes stop_codon:yes gene_type:complete
MSLIYIVSFPNVSSFKKKTIGNHHYIQFKNHQIITPCDLDIKTFTPSNFNLIKDDLNEDHLIIFEKIKSPNKFVQIIDHINKTGNNPLVGNTPFKDKPRFPDISNIYDKKDYGVNQIVCTSVGFEMYNKLNEMNITKYISVISIVGSYIGWKITAFGFSDKIIMDELIFNECIRFVDYTVKI